MTLESEQQQETRRKIIARGLSLQIKTPPLQGETPRDCVYAMIRKINRLLARDMNGRDAKLFVEDTLIIQSPEDDD